MNMLPEPTDKESSTIVGLKALPAPTGVAKHPNPRRGFFRTVGALLGFIHDYTAEDVGRLKEAAVQEVEARPLKSRSEVEVKLAEAAERHAHAEQLRAEAEKTRADAIATHLKAHSEHAVSIAESLERVADAVSRIKQQGGEVAFDEQQLLKLIDMGQLELPKQLSDS